VWEGKPEWKAYLFMALLIIPTIATIIIPIIIIAYILLDRASAEFKVSTKRIMCKYGVLSRRTCELEINDIRSINVSQSFLQRIIGVGNIEFTTAAGPIKEAIIMKIDRPDQLKEQIRSLKK
jgi:uncharacterized membrane protein YdbT with pleckstrin-like domain